MTERRQLLASTARAAALMLAYSVGGAPLLLTPAEARARQLPPRHLSRPELQVLERLCEALAPGATAAGVGHFVDHQLGVEPNDCLLIAKYFQVPPPYADFYRRGLTAVAALAQAHTGKPLGELDAAALEKVVGRWAVPGAKWQGVDLFVFYLCLRSDAVDAVFGTPQGVESLGVPYMAHILPPEYRHA